MEKMEEVSFVKERLRFLVVTRRKLKKCLNRHIVTFLALCIV